MVNKEAVRTGVRGCVVPEMLVHNCTPENVDRELSAILPDGPARSMQLEGYLKVRKLLDTDIPAAANVAGLLYQKLMKE